MRVRPTREGKRFFLILVLIIMAAFNTGNNLIYLIVSMMLSSMVLSLALSITNLRALDLKLEPPASVFAQTETWINYEIANRKRRIPSYSVRMKSTALPEPHTVPFVPADGSSRGVLKTVFPHRGIANMGKTVIETSFPFIFFDVISSAETPVSFTVYPKLMDIGAARSQSAAEGAVPVLLPGDELREIRQYRAGDSLRHINWKATARHSRLMVRETASETGERISIVLDGTGPGAPEAFEKAVSAAASMARQLLEDGYFVSLATASGKIENGIGPGHLRRIFEHLSFVKEDASWNSGAPEAGGILVLKSPNSLLSARAASFRAVIHADRI